MQNASCGGDLGQRRHRAGRAWPAGRRGVALLVAGTITLQDGSLQLAADGSFGQVGQITVTQPAEIFTAAASLEIAASR